MRAAVTEGAGSMVLLEQPEPPAPGPGEVMIRPEAVGICGSDYHFFAGEMSDAAGGSQFPRVQGHELAGALTAVGPRCPAELGVGPRVAGWPLDPRGPGDPGGAGRANAGAHLRAPRTQLDSG